MKNKKIVARLLTILMLISTVLPLFPILTYANGDEVKIKAISDFQIDKELLEAKLDKDLSTDDQILIDVDIKRDANDKILVFQKCLELTENSLLPNDIEVDKEYKDSGEYGEEYTSVRLKTKNKKEETNETETLKESTLEISTSDKTLSKEEISLAFDVKKSPVSGDLFAIIWNKYISVIGYTKEDEIVNEKEDSKNLLKEESEKEESKNKVIEKDSKQEKTQDDIKKDDVFESFYAVGDMGMMSEFLRSEDYIADKAYFGKFTLKKKDENGQPLPGAKFTLYDNNGEEVETLESTDSPDGIVFRNIPIGDYTLKETQAPEGYELLKDYYKINVNKYGFTTTAYVRVGNSSGTNPGGGSGGSSTPIQPYEPPRTSDVIDVESYSLESTDPKTTQGAVDSVWFTSGEFIRMKMKIRIRDGVKRGDSFTIKLDDRLSPTGLRERYIPPIPLRVKGFVVATGKYDMATNSFIYTFTDYVEGDRDIHVEATYDTLGPDTTKVLTSELHGFTNIIDGKPQQEVILHIDYGKSFEFAGGYNKGRKMRNNIASVDRHAGIVERVIYLNNGNGPEDVIHNTWSNQYLELLNNADSTIEKIEVFKVLSSQKNKYMPDSTPGITEGLEKMNSSVKNDDKKITFTFKTDDYKDIETGKDSAGILIKVTEKLSSFRGSSNMTATWGYKFGLGTNSVGMTSSLVDSGAYSQGNSERFNPEISIKNKKIKTAEITVNKKWFRADGQEKENQDGIIIYNLMQIATTSDGKTSEKVLKVDEILTAKDKWTRTYSGLPLKGKNDNGEEVTYTYYISEAALSDYDTSYSNDTGEESKKPSDTAISSGTIIVKNTEKMKFVLPETGGKGRNVIYLIGSICLALSGVWLYIRKRIHVKNK